MGKSQNYPSIDLPFWGRKFTAQDLHTQPRDPCTRVPDRSGRNNWFLNFPRLNLNICCSQIKLSYFDVVKFRFFKDSMPPDASLSVFFGPHVWEILAIVLAYAVHVSSRDVPQLFVGPFFETW